MATLTNTSGSVGMQASFTEVISSGVTATQNLPGSITSQLSYANGTTGGSVDLIYAKQLTLNAATTTLDLTAVADLSNTTQNFARVRELIVQNLSSVGDVKVYANSTSGIVWLPGSASPLFARASTSLAAGGILRISDPATVGAATGNYVSTSSSKLVFDPGANSCSINVIIAGGSATS